ncbi:DUF4893 domain-containing protein [Sphingomonas sp. LB-2]|uniref:DUF4893 domain-containing protein n=1 Tax=Sphingomonas caeni TaxID=2984949 RepID=UPI002231B64C|nr:DUF4893 domain-containing protein [Sphingomonas caeni]MCW3848562.1 DUF4893 domain-containing protein [Sphingomonas caeni]
MIRLAVALALLSLSACSVYREATSTTAFTSDNWRQIATDGDRDRLRGWRKAWDEALPLARAANPGAIAAEPELFDPDRALKDAGIPAGNYTCRTYKLGKSGSGLSDFSASPAYSCVVVASEAGLPSFHKMEGPQRPTGLLFADTPSRQVFLGTLILGDEVSPLRYGLDATRNMAGYVERIGERRWRLVFPYPRFESKLDIIDLVPA